MRDRYQELYDRFRWEVPERFNIAAACCGRWAADRSRFALYWEDEAGATAAYSFWDIQVAANRLSHALAGLGVRRGDRVAIILPQRPEAAIAYMAVFQMGAVALPLSHLFGPDALEYRINHAGASVAIIEPSTIANLWAVRDKLEPLKHVIGVAGARESGVHAWEALLSKGKTSFEKADTAADDPALIIYTSGTTGAPKGALEAHRLIIGNISGFVHSHDFFPQPGDMFWSPADWAWTGGLMDALLPTLYFGREIIGYQGRFDAVKAFELMQRYRVTHTFLFPTALKAMMKAVPAPRERYALRLRAIMSAGEAVGDAVFDYCERALGVTVNEMFGQTEVNYLIGNCGRSLDGRGRPAAGWPARAGSMGRPYPGHRVAVIDDDGRECARGTPGDIAVHRRDIHGDLDPVFFIGYWHNDEATRAKFTGDPADSWCRTGDTAVMDDDGYLWYQGRSDDMFKSAGYRIGPSEVENCLVKHPAVANAAVVPKPDAERGALVKAFVVLAEGVRGSAELVAELQAHVRGKLAPYEYPKEIEFINTLPMTTTGKVQRGILRKLEAQRAQRS